MAKAGTRPGLLTQQIVRDGGVGPVGVPLEVGARRLLGRNAPLLLRDRHHATAQRFGVMSIPTLLVFKSGKVVGKTMGFQPEPKLREFVLASSK